MDSTTTANRTERLSGLFSKMLIVLVAIQCFVATGTISGVAHTRLDLLLLLLASMWILWLSAFICNYRLVDTGTVDVRFRAAPIWVNRPDFPARVLLHVLLNWSTLFLTLLVAWTLRGTSTSYKLAWLTGIATVAVWIGFNIRHRRMNRVRNLAISSSFGLILLIASILLITR